MNNIMTGLIRASLGVASVGSSGYKRGVLDALEQASKYMDARDIENIKGSLLS